LTRSDGSAPAAAARVKECLGNIAVYRQLLDKFPDATAALGE